MNPYGATVEPTSSKGSKNKSKKAIADDSDSLASSDEDNVFVLPSMQKKASLNVMSRKSSKKLSQFKFKMSSNNVIKQSGVNVKFEAPKAPDLQKGAHRKQTKDMIFINVAKKTAKGLDKYMQGGTIALDFSKPVRRRTTHGRGLFSNNPRMKASSKSFTKKSNEKVESPFKK